MNHSFFRLSILGLLLAINTTVFADEFEVDRIRYKTTSSSTVEVSSKSYDNRYSGDIVIPESVDYNGTTYEITSIGSEAFRDCSRLLSVTIGNSVTSIGGGAFQSCSRLASVTIGNSVTNL